VKAAGGASSQKRPTVIYPGGNAYGEERRPTCSFATSILPPPCDRYGSVAWRCDSQSKRFGIIECPGDVYRALGTPPERPLAKSVPFELKNASIGCSTGSRCRGAASISTTSSAPLSLRAPSLLPPALLPRTHAGRDQPTSSNQDSDVQGLSWTILQLGTALEPVFRQRRTPGQSGGTIGSNAFAHPFQGSRC